MSNETYLYCTLDYNVNFLGVYFFKGHIYKLRYDDDDHVTPLRLISKNGNPYRFHPDSPFNKEIRPRHFIPLKEIRKEKIKKLNSL